MEENENRQSAFREISRTEMFEVLEKVALKHKGGVYRLPLLDVSTDNSGIAVISRECYGIIAITWESVISIKHKPAEGDAPGTLTFSTVYGVVTIVVEDNSYDGRHV